MLKRMLAVVLCLAMVITMLPVQAIALETEEPTEMILETEPVEEVTEPAEEVTEPEEEETEPAEEVTEPAEEVTEPAEEVTEPAEEVTEPAEEVTEPTEEETEPAEEVTEPAEEEPELMVLEAPDLDAEELLMGYLSPFYNGDGASSFGIMARDRLSGPNRHLYDGLRDLILRIGRGEENNTSIEVDFRGSGYSGEDVDITVVQNALLFDLPFEMYWYFRVWYALDVNSVWIILEPNAYYVPASGFDPNDAPYIDQSKTRKAAAAATNIGDIIDRYETASDYGKLCGYADEICALVEYDYDAAADSDSLFPKDNRSWTLINVFDGDITTKVVCEGYSEAFQYLCDESNFLGDVVCFSATGNNHKWNIVRIDGVSYLMDVTHCDNGDYAYRGPKFLGGGSGSVTGGYAIGGFLYKYYDETLDVYGDGEDSILKLSPVPYTPTGTYHVVYSVDGDTGLIASQTKTGGEELTITDEVPYILGYNFIGWVTSPTATEPDYQPGDTYSADADMVLYALFEESDVITGTEPGSSWVANVRYPGVTVLYTFRPEISGNYRIYSTADNDTVLDIYNGEGYWIAGDDDSGGSLQFQLDREFQAGEVYYLDVMFFGNTRTGELPFHISRQLTISYDANGGTGAPAAEYQYYQFPMALSDVIPTRGEDAFLGWATSPTATEAEYQPYDTYYAEDDVTLYAVWRSADCSHSFVDSVCERCGIIGGSCGENLTWTLDDAGILTIIGIGEMNTYSREEPAPWYDHREKITALVVEHGVTKLLAYAFADCINLTSVTLPTTVTWVTYSTFEGCTSLVDIYISDITAWISGATTDRVLECNTNGKKLYLNGQLITDLVIPNGVKKIGSGAFSRCISLCNVSLPDGVTTIEYGAFEDCSSLKTIDLPTSITSIGASAFRNCTDLTSVTIHNGVTKIGNMAFENCTSLEEIRLPSSITSIGIQAFYNCANLTEVTILNGVTDIGEAAFRNCISLLEATIPNSVISIGERVFDSCTSLTSVTIGDGVTGISSSAFYGCSSLADVTIGRNVSSIGSSAFYGCTSLVELPITNTVTNIGAGSFAGCTGLINVVIPDSVVNIERMAFYGCKNLKTVDIWGNDVEIGQPTDGASLAPATFGMCDSLERVTFHGTVKTVGSNAFRVFYSDDVNNGNITSNVKEVVFEKAVDTIDSGAFSESGNLTTLVFNGHVKTVGESAFSRCNSLKEVVFAQGVDTIGKYGFNSCENLALVSIPTGNVSLSYGTFYNCEKLRDIDFQERITSFGESTFAMCGSIESFIISDHITEIPGRTFNGAFGIKTLIVGENVQTIGNNAFGVCAVLESVVFTGDAPSFSNNVFWAVTTTAYYPYGNPTWTSDVMQDYGGTITWVPYGGVENRITIPTEELNGQTSVWIDGREYSVNTDSGTPYVDLPNGNAKTMVVYTYGESNGKSYPMGMKVWLLSNTDGLYTATRAEALDNILGYEGCSIRAGGQPGIRMITSVPDAMKYQLINGWEGYTLSEYGTAVAWADQISGSRPLTLGKSYVSHAYAYSLEDGKDPIHEPGDRIQYTNVLVGFTLDQCKEDIAMRPYMILADAEGNEITLYGGIVERSIGYIAQLNANAFDSETQADAYNFVHQIIDHVYGG